MMKTAFSISTLARVSKQICAIVFCMLFLAVSAQAQQNKATPSKGSIAVVDLQFLVSNSKAGKSIRNQLETARKSYGAQIEKQQSGLQAEEKSLVAQQPKLSREDFQKRGKALGEKVIKARQAVYQRQAAFEKAYAVSMEKLREHIVKIVADIAGKNDIALVLNRQEVVLVDAKMDLTKEVLTALDARVTSIPVSIK